MLASFRDAPSSGADPESSIAPCAGFRVRAKEARPGMTESRQQALARNVVELQPDAIGILEQQRIISRRPFVLARRANDRRADRAQEAVHLVDIGALAGTK